MRSRIVSSGTVHELPADLEVALLADNEVLMTWEGLTPLARNEWICWVISVKQESTRQNHVKRTISELKEGQRRPCCWIGCIHRTDKPISKSVQGILDKRSRSSKSA